MAKRIKKINKGLVAFLCVIALIFGAALGYAAKTFLFTTTYEIPATVKKPAFSSGTGYAAEQIKEYDLSVHFIELGNKYTGDCTFIKVGKTEILIDAGSRQSSVNAICDYVTPYIEDGLDYVIVTHAHQDHYAGFATNENVESVFDKLKPKTVITFAKTNQKESSALYKNFKRELKETVERSGTKVYTAMECYAEENGAQRTYSLGDNTELEILYQKYYEQAAKTENDYSVCAVINQTTSDGVYRYLFTGDLEKDGEESLAESNNLGAVKLYKAGHHGSKTSSSEKLLAAIKPEVVCVCACAGSSEYTSKNENQFPTQAFIDRVAVYTEKVYVTSLCVDYEKGEFTSMNGNIVYSAKKDGKTKMYFSASDTPLYLTDWFKSNRTAPQPWQ